MDKLSRLQELIKKTGDKIVLFSEFDDNDLIIMPLSEYEKLIEPHKALKDMDEKELLSRINRDINLWKENQLEKEWEDELDFNSPWTQNLDAINESVSNEDLFSPEDFNQSKDMAEEKISDSEELKEPWSENMSPVSDLESSEEDEELAATPISPENNVINYEHIPPPPDIIMPREDIKLNPEKIIDLSLENEPTLENNEFDEEPVY